MSDTHDYIAQGRSLLLKAKVPRDELSELWYKYPKGGSIRDTLGLVIHDSNVDFSTMESYMRRKDLRGRENSLYGLLKRNHRWLRIIELIVTLAKE